MPRPANYTDELMRASARPDIDDLRRATQAFFEYAKLPPAERAKFLSNDSTGIDRFFYNDDPDLGLALATLAASMFDDRFFLLLVATGTLEDILRNPTSETIARVVAEARKNARFRWMLTGVWLHAISEEARPHIAAVIGSMTENDPVPPRSF